MASSLQVTTDAPASVVASPSGETLSLNCPAKLLLNSQPQETRGHPKYLLLEDSKVWGFCSEEVDNRVCDKNP